MGKITPKGESELSAEEDGSELSDGAGVARAALSAAAELTAAGLGADDTRRKR